MAKYGKIYKSIIIYKDKMTQDLPPLDLIQFIASLSQRGSAEIDLELDADIGGSGSCFVKYSRIYGSVRDGEIDLELDADIGGSGSCSVKYSRIRGKFKID
jgi:hypothetical protein